MPLSEAAYRKQVTRGKATVYPNERDALNRMRDFLREKLDRYNLTQGQAIVEAERIVREAFHHDDSR